MLHIYIYIILFLLKIKTYLKIYFRKTLNRLSENTKNYNILFVETSVAVIFELFIINLLISQLYLKYITIITFLLIIQVLGKIAINLSVMAYFYNNI